MKHKPPRAYSRAEMERLWRAADAIAHAINVEPETIGTTGVSNNIALTLEQAEAVVALLFPGGQHTLRGMDESRCHWVERKPDGDYQCDMSPGHWRESSDARALYTHQPTIRLTERLPLRALEHPSDDTCQS